MHDRRNFLIFAINRILEFCDRRNFCIRDRRNVVIFAIDGIFYVRDRRIFVMFAIDGIFIFRDQRIKRSNQAIAMSDRRIKRSKVSISLKIRDREFSPNWNSGIPEKEKKREKIPFHQAHNGALKTFFKAFFSSPTQMPEKEEQ